MNDDDVLPPGLDDWPQPIEVRLFRAALQLKRTLLRSRLGRRLARARVLWQDFWWTW